MIPRSWSQSFQTNVSKKKTATWKEVATLPETNSEFSPENPWLQDDMSFLGNGLKSGLLHSTVMEIYKGTPQMPPFPKETKPYWKPLKPYFLEEGVAFWRVTLKFPWSLFSLKKSRTYSSSKVALKPNLQGHEYKMFT